MTDDIQVKNWRDRIVKAVFLVMIAHFMVKCVSLLQNRFIGQFFNKEERDFFVIIFKNIFLTIFFIGEESLGPIFLPYFMQLKEKFGEKKAWNFSSWVFNWYVVFLTIFSFLMIFEPSIILGLWTRWQVGTHDRLINLAQEVLPYLIPGMFGICLGSLTYLLLNAKEKFFWAAWGDGMVKIMILIGILTGGFLYMQNVPHSDVMTKQGMKGLVFVICGISAGGVAKLLCHLIALGKDIKHYRPSLCLEKDLIKPFLLLLLPLIVGILFAKFRDIFNNSYILSDHKGLTSANAFGKTIADSIHYLVPYAVSIALLPYFCMLAEKKEDEKFSEILANSARTMLFLFVPLAAILIVIAFPLTRGFYETGKFTIGDSKLAAIANAFYLAGLPFAALEAVFMQAFFSKRSIWLPITLGIICSSVSIVISYIGIIILKVPETAMLGVVAGGYVFSRALKSILLGFFMNKITGFLKGERFRDTVKMLSVTISIALLVSIGLNQFYDFLIAKMSFLNTLANSNSGKIKTVFFLSKCGLIAGPAFLLFFLASCRLKFSEPIWLLEWAMQKYSFLDKPIIHKILFGKKEI